MDDILHLIWQINYKVEQVSLTIDYVGAATGNVAGTINLKNGSKLSFSSINECQHLLDTRFEKGTYT